MRTTTKRSAGVASVVVGLIGLSIAFAAWTSSGTGSGDVTAGTAEELTVTVSDVDGLFPTKSVDVPFTVTNPNPYDVTLSNVTLDEVTTDKVGCDASVVTGADVSLSDVVAAGEESDEIPFPVTMSNAAADACQGAAFTVTLTVTGQSS